MTEPVRDPAGDVWSNQGGSLEFCSSQNKSKTWCYSLLPTVISNTVKTFILRCIFCIIYIIVQSSEQTLSDVSWVMRVHTCNLKSLSLNRVKTMSSTDRTWIGLNTIFSWAAMTCGFFVNAVAQMKFICPEIFWRSLLQSWVASQWLEVQWFDPETGTIKMGRKRFFLFLSVTFK